MLSFVHECRGCWLTAKHDPSTKMQAKPPIAAAFAVHVPSMSMRQPHLAYLQLCCLWPIAEFQNVIGRVPVCKVHAAVCPCLPFCCLSPWPPVWSGPPVWHLQIGQRKFSCIPIAERCQSTDLGPQRSAHSKRVRL